VGNWPHLSAATRVVNGTGDFAAAAKAWRKADGTPRAAGVASHERPSEMGASTWHACPGCRKAT